jgi:hypothetical protein
VQTRHIHLPPHKLYAFEGAWRFTWDGTLTIFGWAMAIAINCSQQIEALQKSMSYKDGWEKFFAGLLMFLWGSICVTLFFLFLILCALWLALLGSIFGLWAGFLLLVIRIVRGCVSISKSHHHITYPCPNCYKEMILPTFRCDECNTERSRLWPSTYGIFSQRCASSPTDCQRKLPTLDSWGRKKLRRFCPACLWELDLDFGQGTTINIPLIGAVSAGKTSFIITSLDTFIATYINNYGYKINFTNLVYQGNFNIRKRELAHGQRPAPTHEIVPLAFSLKIEAPRKRVPAIAFFYDPAGEIVQSDVHMIRQKYYKYVHGCIFVIDPCSIPAYYIAHKQEIDQLRSVLGPSRLSTADEIMSQLTKTLERYRDIKRWGRYPMSVAVVITKVDALGLENVIGLTAAEIQARMEKDKTPGDAMHTLVQDFLEQHGLSNLVRRLDWEFSDVRYFACSALGRLPVDSDKSAFVPHGVLEPLEWLLRNTRIIDKYP